MFYLYLIIINDEDWWLIILKINTGHLQWYFNRTAVDTRRDGSVNQQTSNRYLLDNVIFFRTIFHRTKTRRKGSLGRPQNR